ncbi:hypothetical protein L915_00237 [Phytophthora nicotianae]|uniref:Uncharacterized protein n=1 Tax=Phytophthora nicotianae TaxID=4792 RepID=W2JVZ6_PHYNI|nr:hypothetical protein L915_00237 [Phytophthora nicotianae]ETL50536.1 hypothetical protein L916_00239 [Phytophthora nicotianae]
MTFSDAVDRLKLRQLRLEPTEAAPALLYLGVHAYLKFSGICRGFKVPWAEKWPYSVITDVLLCNISN